MSSNRPFQRLIVAALLAVLSLCLAAGPPAAAAKTAIVRVNATAAGQKTAEKTVVPLELGVDEFKWGCGDTKVFADDGGQEVTRTVTVSRGNVQRTTETSHYRNVHGYTDTGKRLRIRSTTVSMTEVRTFNDGGHELIDYRTVSRYAFLTPGGAIGTWGFSYDASGRQELNHGSCVWDGQ